MVCPCSGCSGHSSGVGIVLALGFKLVPCAALIKDFEHHLSYLEWWEESVSAAMEILQVISSL